jgi:hypothetical protein
MVPTLFFNVSIAVANFWSPGFWWQQRVSQPGLRERSTSWAEQGMLLCADIVKGVLGMQGTQGGQQPAAVCSALSHTCVGVGCGSLLSTCFCLQPSLFWRWATWKKTRSAV